MEKLPLPALFAALVMTGGYGRLRHPPPHELEEMFLVCSALLSAVYYLGRWGWRRCWPKPAASPDEQ
jgi:hypothetical protein